jgi:hypothetical protein
MFAERAEMIVGRYPNARRALVVGCGPGGYLVDDLLARGVNAWGMDASAWAVSEAQAALGERIVLGDGCVLAEYPPGPWDLVVSEDCLPCCDDGECVAMASAMGQAGAAVLHIISCEHGDEHCAPLNWRTQAEWRALLGVGDCFDAITREAF